MYTIYFNSSKLNGFRAQENWMIKQHIPHSQVERIKREVLRELKTISSDDPNEVLGRKWKPMGKYKTIQEAQQVIENYKRL